MRDVRVRWAASAKPASCAAAESGAPSLTCAQDPEADRFWVAYAPENYPSGNGIHKAGFETVAQISFDMHGRPAIRMLVDGAPNPGPMLGLPSLQEALAQCWRCVRMGKKPDESCLPAECRCDYQRPEKHCA
jgi:hypothetical protein